LIERIRNKISEESGEQQKGWRKANRLQNANAIFGRFSVFSSFSVGWFRTIILDGWLR
jgi:hypothetical protein